MIRTLLAALLLLTSPAWAVHPIDDAAAAYARGDYAAELRITRPLAAKGEAWAQFNLGVMYLNGHGVARDNVRAHMWFNLAAVRGDTDAVKNRDIAAKGMTPQQMAEEQKLARECQARDFKGCE